MFRILIDVNLIGRLRGFDVASLGSDRFRIFSAQAKGAFQCHEISPRVRFALRVKKVTATKLTVGTSIHGQVCENPPELTPSMIVHKAHSVRTDRPNQPSSKIFEASERLRAHKATVATHVSLEPESAWPFRAQPVEPVVRFFENLIAPDKSSWPKHCVTLS